MMPSGGGGTLRQAQFSARIDAGAGGGLSGKIGAFEHDGPEHFGSGAIGSMGSGIAPV